jgi:pyridoxal phosphate enzyme (YggS family)
MSPIASNLQGVYRARDAAIAVRPARFSEPVAIVAVSKTKPAADVVAAFAAGQRMFGENYVQEGCEKIQTLRAQNVEGIEWHLIGPLQSNKAKLAALNFDWVQSVDRMKIAEALSRHRTDARLPVLNVLLQVNVSGEVTKSGVAPADARAVADAISLLPGLQLRGLMSIVENTRDEAELRDQFRTLRTMFDAMRSRLSAVDTLSMGMSGDFSIAIQEGATMVRIGSMIFGARGAVAANA